MVDSCTRVMLRSDGHASLAQIPYNFNAGEICSCTQHCDATLRMSCMTPMVMQISPALKRTGIWARMYDDWWHTSIRGDKLNAKRWLICNSEQYGEWHPVPILSPNKSSQTDQFDTRCCLEWCVRYYTQITQRVHSCGIFLSVHSTCPLVLAWSSLYWCCSKFVLDAAVDHSHSLRLHFLFDGYTVQSYNRVLE